jgi:hypothetical protein
MRLESPRVGSVFAELVAKTREHGRQYRRDAWAASPATKDTDMNTDLRYSYDNEMELEKCISLMQGELSVTRILIPHAFLRRQR